MTYRVWYLAGLGSAWAVPTPLLFVEFGILAATAAWSVRRVIARRQS